MKFDGVFKPLMKGDSLIPIIGDGSVEIGRHGICVNAFWINLSLFRVRLAVWMLIFFLIRPILEFYNFGWTDGTIFTIAIHFLVIIGLVLFLLGFSFHKLGERIQNINKRSSQVYGFFMLYILCTGNISLLFRLLGLGNNSSTWINLAILIIGAAYTSLFYYFLLDRHLIKPDLNRPLAFCIPWKNIKEIRKSKKEEDKSVIIFIEDFDFRKPLVMSYNNKCVLNFYPSQGVENFLQHYNYIVVTLEQSAGDEDGK